MIFLLFYSYDDGSREDWNTFYTPVEVFSSDEDRKSRIAFITEENPDLAFHTLDIDGFSAIDAEIQLEKFVDDEDDDEE